MRVVEQEEKRMIPVYIQPGVQVFPDGREVCDLKTVAGRREFRLRVLLMWHRQGERCCLCHHLNFVKWMEFEHQDGKGMGGAHRDDRIMKDGKPYNGASCHWCNAAKGSRRIDYNADSQSR